jgi:predicted amidohydrolase
MRIALAQLAVIDGDAWANVERAEAMLREVARERPDVALLPELWTTGYAHDSWGPVADAETPKVMDRLAALSGELGIVIGGSMVHRRADGGLMNRFTLTAPDGTVMASYDKSHLFMPMREHEFLAAGDAREHGAVGKAPVALSICYDLRFPAMYRASAQEGTELFLVVSEWPDPRAAVLRTLATARAVENQAFLALCNRTGTGADGTTFCGGSMVVSPSGEILLDLGRDEGTGVVEVRLREVAMTRAMLPVLTQDVVGVDG